MPPARPTHRAGGTVRITYLDPAAVLEQAANLIAIAVAVFTAPPWNEPPALAARAALRLLTDSAHGGFTAAVATREADLCGFAYGVRSRHLETLAGAAPSPLVPFELRELATDPRHRGTGIGAQLHDAIAQRTVGTPGWLTTHPAARPALNLYRSRGWSTAALLYGPETPRLLMRRS